MAAVARFIAGGALRRSSAALASFGFRPASSAAASADERRAPESLLGMWRDGAHAVGEGYGSAVVSRQTDARCHI